MNSTQYNILAEKINRLMNAWTIRCMKSNIPNSMNWVVGTPIKSRDASYLFQLYFRWRRLDTIPPISEEGRQRLNLMWSYVREYWDYNFNHHKHIMDNLSKYEYEKEPLVY